MNRSTLQHSVTLGNRLGHVFVATSGEEGVPHVTTADNIHLMSENTVAVSGWFCPGTSLNLNTNRHVSLVVWDPYTDMGYQLIGQVRQVRDLAILDGYSPDTDHLSAIPQVDRELTIRVDHIYSFSRTPHTDQEE